MSDIRVLIVEDEPMIAEDIAAGLERNDFIVSAICYHLEDALNELNNNLPDIALLDINLNGQMHGFTLAEEIQNKHFIPFIFITSYSDKTTLDKAKLCEPYGYIVKPFNAASLYTTVEIALHNFSQRNKRSFPELNLQKLNNHLTNPITEREFDLLKLIYEGKTNKQIADEMFISTNTVKKHINNTYLKIDTISRATTITKLRNLMLP